MELQIENSFCGADNDSIPKKKHSIEETRQFLRKTRKSLKSPIPDNDFTVHFWFEDNTKVRSPTTSMAYFDTKDYICIKCSNRSFYIPLTVALNSSQWMRFMQKNEEDESLSFKENVSRTIEFNTFNPDAFEYVISWLMIDFSLNAVLSPTSIPTTRVTFQFSLPEELVMDILHISHFLEIEPLTNFCLVMLGEYLDDVPSLDQIPVDLVEKILCRLQSQQLCTVEAREDFQQLQIDTSHLWQKMFTEKGWDVKERTHIYSWDKFPDSSNLLIEQQSFVNWKALFLQRFMQEKSLSIAGEKEFKNFLTDLEKSGPFITKHSIMEHYLLPSSIPLKSYLKEYLNKLTHLTFLELSGIEISEYKDHLKNYLDSHEQCVNLRLAGCHISDGTIVASFLESTKIESLDLSNNQLNKKLDLDPFLKVLAGNNYLKKLSLYGNNISRSVCSFFDVLYSSKVEVLDLGANSIYFFSTDDLKSLKFNVSLKTLLLYENPLGRDFGGSDISILFSNLSQNLTALDISCCDLRDVHCSTLVECLKQRTIPLNLKMLNIDSNRIRKDSQEIRELLEIVGNLTITDMFPHQTLFYVY